MKQYLHLMVVLFTLLLGVLASPAAAQYFSEQQLAKVATVKVTVENNADNGCLLLPDTVKTNAESILLQSGIRVTNVDHIDNHELALTAVGTGTCLAAFKVELSRFEVLGDETIGVVLAASDLTVLIGSKESFRMQIDESVKRFVTDLAGEIEKAHAGN